VQVADSRSRKTLQAQSNPQADIHHYRCNSGAADLIFLRL